LAFESLPGVKIHDFDTKQSFIIADLFSVYENPEELPEIYKWTDFNSITETIDAFIFKIEASAAKNGTIPGKEFIIPTELIPDPAVHIRIRAIIEGMVAANPKIEYKHGRRILPPKTLCSRCEIPPEAYIANGSYKESEINNSNVILHNSDYYKMIWIFAPIAMVLTFIAQAIFLDDTFTNIINFLTVLTISVFAGGVAGISMYLFCAYGAKTLYRKILKEDPALLEEITFVICDDGFIAAETEVYDFSDIIHWHQVAYFIETNHVYIIFNRNRAVFWLPKRMFPKELHQELGDFIADRLQQK